MFWLFIRYFAMDFLIILALYNRFQACRCLADAFHVFCGMSQFEQIGVMVALASLAASTLSTIAELLRKLSG